MTLKNLATSFDLAVQIATKKVDLLKIIDSFIMIVCFMLFMLAFFNFKRYWDNTKRGTNAVLQLKRLKIETDKNQKAN